MPDNASGPQQQPEAVRSQTFMSIYSNSAQLEVTPWDFRLIFGELKPEANKPPKIEQLVSIIMSPQHAKALVQMLTTYLQEYEKNVGEIKLPVALPVAAGKTQ